MFGVMRGQSQEKNSRALLSMISTIQFRHSGKRKNTSVDILLHRVFVKGSFALVTDSILQRLDGRSEKSGNEAHTRFLCRADSIARITRRVCPARLS